MQDAAKCVDLSPQLKYCICPQCVKAKINSSIKGRSYLKHLNCFFFFLKFLSHLQMLAHQKNNNNNKTKNQKQKQKQKAKRKKKKRIERKEN